jgi:hypothetical protein
MSWFSFEVAKIVGVSSRTSWSQVHTFFPKDQKKLEERGQLLALISLKRSELEAKEEIVSFGREAIARLHEEYFGNLEGEILERLKKAVAQVAEEAGDGLEVEIVAAAVKEETAYLAVFSQGRVILKRDNSVAAICRGSEDDIKTASGHLEDQDLLFLGTSPFFEILAEGVLKAALLTDSVQEVMEVLTPMVYGKPGFESAAALVTKIKSEGISVIADQPLPAGEETIKESGEKRKRRTRRWSGLGKRFFLVSFFRKATALMGKKSDRSGISLGRLRPPGSRKKSPLALILAIAFSFLLIASLFWGFRQRSFSLRQKEIEISLIQARTKLEEGEVLIELNPIRARELLTEAEEILGQLKEEEADQEITLLRQEIQAALRLVLREHELAELSLFFDLKIIKEEGKGKDLILLEKKLIIIDSENRAVYGIDSETKRGEILAGGEDLKDSYHLAGFEERVFVLTPGGIVENDFEADQQKTIVEADEGWEKIVDFSAYGGNLYLLDQGNLDLYRYPVIEGGFGAKQSWFKGEKGSLDQAVSMAIDGSVWVLKADGEILKFTHGFNDPFGIAGLDKDFSSPQMIYTDPDQESLYVLDRNNQRLVVLGKDGEYRSQYLWPDQKEIDKIVVSEAVGKAWLLEGSRLYQIDLKS